MNIQFVPLRWRDALAVARWRYPEPYAYYNGALAPMLSIVIVQIGLRATRRPVYYSVLGSAEELVGIFSFVRNGPIIEIGLGMRPDLTGNGDGLAFVAAGLDFARRSFRPSHFRLDVARFNERAIRVYERSGFVPTREFERAVGDKRYAFVEMQREA
ncbi:MAG: GNAT family N-acetyltransferase [Ktedonobacterales bacterium]